MEINNFREAFERGDDPTADMTDASDINSVAGVLKLYLRCSSSPSSSSRSSPLSPPGSCETQYFLFNTLTSSWSLHVSSFFSKLLSPKVLNQQFCLSAIFHWYVWCLLGRREISTNNCLFIIFKKHRALPHWAGGQGNGMENSFLGSGLIWNFLKIWLLCRWHLYLYICDTAGDHPIPVLHSKNISRMPSLLWLITAWI